MDLFKVQGKKVLAVEDVFTTGQSVAQMVNFLKENDSEVVGVGGVWNRGGVTADDLGVNVFISQINQQYLTFQPGEDCLGCRNKILYDLKLGHGKNLIGGVSVGDSTLK